MTRNRLRYGVMAIGTIGLAALPGCRVNQGPVPAPMATARPAGPKFSLNTPVERIVANPLGKAILLRDVPGLMASQKYILFEDMSLSEIAVVSHGRLTQEKLDLVQADLSRLDGSAQ